MCPCKGSPVQGDQALGLCWGGRQVAGGGSHTRSPNLYHGSEATPLSQGDAFTEGSQLCQARTIQCPLVLFKAALCVQPALMQLGQLAPCLHDRDTGVRAVVLQPALPM